MKKPRLEEVKEHFKDAKIVKYLIGTNESQLIPHSIFTDGHDFYAHRTDGEGYIKLWSPSGYAEIVEYKDEIILGFEISTDENIKYLKTHKPMGTQQNNTEITMTFETVGAVEVILTSKNLDNLTTIANMIK